MLNEAAQDTTTTTPTTTTNPTTTPKPATSSTVDEFREILRMELDNVKAILAAEVSCLTHAAAADDDDEYDDDSGALTQVSAQETKIDVVLDSGSVTSVIHPKDLPRTVAIVPNIGGRHFKGAGIAGHHIETTALPKRPCVPRRTLLRLPVSGLRPTCTDRYTQLSRSPALSNSPRLTYCFALVRQLSYQPARLTEF